MNDVQQQSYSGVPRWDNPAQANGSAPVDDVNDDGGQNSAKLFERSRIKALADEREAVQKKTFTKWVNSHLARVGCRINDLYIDLRDGRMLIKLLEVLSGEKLPKPTRGKMRIHCLENVDKSLSFLGEQRVHLENMGAHDIVDGSQRLTLGLIWTIILRFQIQDITFEEMEDAETKSAKDALLLWCQMKTAGYANVNVRNFTTSWRDGLAFNALIHRHRPDLLQYEKLSKTNAPFNLNHAFNIAEERLGVAKLLDAEDVNVEMPDEKSIITYVVTFYHYFSKMKAESVQGKRIGKVLNSVLDNERAIREYETLTSDLLRWIEQTVAILNERDFENSLQGVQSQLTQFNAYRTIEKPPKFTEKGNLEIMLFTLQSQIRANNQKPYLPKEGKMISDINKAWERLERAEHGRELALRQELIRQEKLEQLAARFDRKAGMRETWLSENQRLVSHDNFGVDLAAVEAATKKHEAIETDIYAYEERVQAVVAVAYELEQETYHDLMRINARKENVLRLWNYLLELLRARRMRLELSLQIQKIFQEMLYILDCMEEIKSRLLSEDSGKHLLGVEDLLQKHQLLEADMTVVGNRVSSVNASAQKFADADFPDVSPKGYKPCNPQIVKERMQSLDEAYAELLDLSTHRRDQLDESRRLWQFFWDMADEEGWIREKEQLMSSPDLGHDLTSVHGLLGKHKAHEDEMAARQRSHLEGVRQCGDELIATGHFGADKIRARTEDIDSQWHALQDLAVLRRQRLLEAVDFYQFFADADDVDHWMVDTLRLVSSDDVGKDEASAQSLLKKHRDATEELKSYSSVIEALHQQAESLGEQDRSNPDVQGRLASIDRRYKDLEELANLREQRLLDALTLYGFYNEVDNIEDWIADKEVFLESMVYSPHDPEELEVVKQRFDGFEREMSVAESKVEAARQVARDLLAGEHPSADQILQRQQRLDDSWQRLIDIVTKQREQLAAAESLANFYVEVNETMSWITEKMKVVESTDELGNDLAGVMALQRRLAGMERDLAAIQSKVDLLAEEASRLGCPRPITEVSGLEEDAEARMAEQPAEAEGIRQKLDDIKVVWKNLKDMLAAREERLGSASELQRFLHNLDHFQQWLADTQTAIASEDMPASLAEAERLLALHRGLHDDIGQHTPEYDDLQKFGAATLAAGVPGSADGDDEAGGVGAAGDLMDGHSAAAVAAAAPSEVPHVTADAAQLMFLGQRLKLLQEGWAEVQQMWETKQASLDQSLQQQIFLRDAAQADVLLNQQENFLSKEEVPSTTMDRQTALENAENMIKRHEAFITTMDANNDKLNQVIQSAQKLIDDGHFAAEKVSKKSEDVARRRDANRDRALEQLRRLREGKRLLQLLADCDELGEWLDEKTVAAQDETYRDAKSVHSKYMRHQAFAAEIASNRDRLELLKAEGERLAEEQPEDGLQVSERIAALATQWDELEETTRAKGERLFDANRQVLFEQGCEDIDGHLDDIESQIIVTDVGQDLTTVNLHLSKHNKLEAELATKREQAVELESQAVILRERDPARAEEIERRQVAVQERIQALEAPLAERRLALDRTRQVHQFLRDVEDETLWISERQRLADDPNVGSSLQSVQTLQKKNQSLRTEIDNHAPRVEEVCQSGQLMLAAGYPQSEGFQEDVDQLLSLWKHLNDSVEARKARLDDSEVLQQWYFDAAEAEAWMGEQELFLIADDRAKDEIGAAIMLKKHAALERTIEDYANTVRQLNERAVKLMAENRPESDQISRRQSQVGKLYAGLKDLAGDRRRRLDETLKLYMLNRDVDELEQWIAEREQFASSQELGQDFEHVSMLSERFKEFQRDTRTVGEDRVERAVYACDALIDAEHTDAATIAEWKDGINEAWGDLVELMATRAQQLLASWNLHKFFNDCKETLDRIVEKKNAVPEELGRDVKSVEALQRKHATFENDLMTLGSQVQNVQEEAAVLLAAYAGDKQAEIRAKEAEVVDAWRALQLAVGVRKGRLDDANDFYRFLALALDLTLWMDDIALQIGTQERPRDVSGVELLMNNHQSVRAEIDARDENFNVCINLGKDLLARNHYRSAEVREKLVDLQSRRGAMMQQWEDKWDYLQIILEVYQFARDADAAEAWLAAQEPYLQLNVLVEMNETLEAVDGLLRKHEAFEKSTAAQEDRFLALDRLTTMEVREKQKSSAGASGAATSVRDKYIEDFSPPSPIEGAIPTSEEPAAIDEPAQAANIVVTVETSFVADEPASSSMRVEEDVKPSRAAPVAASAATSTLPARVRPDELGATAAAAPAASVSVKRAAPPRASVRASMPLPPVGAPGLAPEDSLLAARRDSWGERPASASSSLPTTPRGTPSKRAAERGQSSAGDDDGRPLEGALMRKHEYESAGVKASHRAWDKLWCVQRGNQLCFYKDHKHAKETGSYYRSEQPLTLTSATCEVPSNYTKKPHVLRVSLLTGAAYLLQLRTEDEQTTWLRRLAAATGSSTAEPGSPSKSKTMPSTPPNKKDDSSKKRGRFTLKKN